MSTFSREVIDDAGNLALALVNTQGEIRHGPAPSGVPGLDALRAPGALVGWLAAAGLLHDPWPEVLRSPPKARIALSEALRLRDHVQEVLAATKASAPVAGLTLFGINRILSAGRRSLELVRQGGRFELIERSRTDTARALLEPVARAAAELLTSVDPERVRRCAADACGFWFVDTSKSGRRKWCSMERCGNRAKAARHRRRRAEVG